LISKKFLRIIKWVWIIAVILAGSYYLITNWEKMVEIFAMVPKLNLLYSALFIIFGKFCLFLLAKYSVDREGFHLPYQQVFFIVATTQLGKYIPGGVWHFVGRYNAYQNEEISLTKSTKAMISENLWLLSGALMVGASFGIYSKLGKDFLAGNGLSVPFPVLYNMFIFLLWVLLLIGYEAILQRKFPSIKTLKLLKLILNQTLTWAFLGISFLFIFPENSLSLLPDAVFGFAISWAIGYIAIFAPGGIGIREGALVWIFSSLFAPEDMLIFSTVHRFLYVAVEFLMGFLSLLLQPLLIVKNTRAINPEKDKKIS